MRTCGDIDTLVPPMTFSSLGASPNSIAGRDTCVTNAVLPIREKTPFKTACTAKTRGRGQSWRTCGLDVHEVLAGCECLGFVLDLRGVDGRTQQHTRVHLGDCLQTTEVLRLQARLQADRRRNRNFLSSIL